MPVVKRTSCGSNCSSVDASRLSSLLACSALRTATLSECSDSTSPLLCQASAEASGGELALMTILTLLCAVFSFSPVCCSSFSPLSDQACAEAKRGGQPRTLSGCCLCSSSPLLDQACEEATGVKALRLIGRAVLTVFSSCSWAEPCAGCAAKVVLFDVLEL